MNLPRFLRLINRDYTSKLLLMLFLSALISSYHTTGTVRASSAGEIIWTQINNPSAGGDIAIDAAVDGSGAYVVGYDSSPGVPEWRIEKRSLTDGSLIWSQTSNPGGAGAIARGVAVDGSGIYVVGYDNTPGDHEWRIEKRSLTDGSLIWSQTNDPSGQWDEAEEVALDGSGLYIVGYDRSPGDSEWRVEKRSLADGSLAWTQTSNPSGSWDYTSGVAVDVSGIYIVGFDSSPGTGGEWRIEKRSLTDGSLIPSFGAAGAATSNPSTGDDRASGVALDGSGLYIVGYDRSLGNNEWRVEKRSLADGSLIWSQTENLSAGNDGAYGVAVDGSGVYIVGIDNSPMPGTSDFMWRIEKRSLTDGSPIWSQFNNPSTDNDGTNGIALDSSGVYMAGFDSSPGNYEWRTEKRNLGLPANKLVITVYPSSVTAGSWTTKYTVQRQDQFSNPATSGSTVVNLASTSTGANKKFAETSGGSAVASVTIPDGSSTKDFYYYDDKAGAWAISVSAAGLTGDSKPLTVNPKTGCIVATAAYGSEMAPEVVYMRHVRDRMIGSNEVGRLLVDGWNTFYYSWSPPMAEWIASSGALQPTLQILLLPLIATVHSTALIYTTIAPINAAFASVAAFLFAAVSSITIYILTPLFTFRSIHRKRSKLHLNLQ